MQNLISKWGTAAHLALTLVAPLLLFPFFGAEDVASVLFWMSIVSLIWVLMEPSRLKGEYSYDARARVFNETIHDPLFWGSLVFLVIGFIRYLNDGVAIVYNAEKYVWELSTPASPFLPAALKGSAWPPLAMLLTLVVTLAGCRHALGRRARICFLSLLSFFAGIGAIVAVIAFYTENPRVLQEVMRPWDSSSFVGTGFGIAFVAGLAGLAGLFDCHERKAIFPVSIGVGACAMGLIFFSPAAVILPFLGLGLIVILLSVGYLFQQMSKVESYKYISMVLIASLVPILALVSLKTDALLADRTMFWMSGTLFPANYETLHSRLNEIALTGWTDHTWLGTGTGTFPSIVRFQAQPADWALFTSKSVWASNVWLVTLTETGVLGILLALTVPAYLLVTLVFRLVNGKKNFFWVSVVLGVLLTVFLGVEAWFDATLLRPEVCLIGLAVLAIAVKTIPQKPRGSLELKAS